MFSDKLVVVTGGASGIGAATTRILAERGARVAILDRDEKRATALAEDLGSDRVTTCIVNLSDEADILHTAQKLKSSEPSIAGLVNAAGIFGGKNIEAADAANWNLVLSVNLVAPTLLARALLPCLKQGKASVVNILSDGAFKGRPNGPYDASKAGLWSATKSMAACWTEHGMRVNAVAPGWTVTEIHYNKSDHPEKRRQQLLEWDTDNYCLMKRVALPQEIANAIVFLLSDESSYINGTTLNVDGGRIGF